LNLDAKRLFELKINFRLEFLGLGWHSNAIMLDEEALKQQELAEKKKRRLERNRASARECRKRKKEKKLHLRAQLARLEADNLQLRLKLQVGKEPAVTSFEKSAIITQKLDEMINVGVSESEIQAKIQELKERFSDYGRDRRSAIDFHINQVRRCLQPTQTTRAILWVMSLAPRFASIIDKVGQINTTSSSTTQSINDEISLILSPEEKELYDLWRNLLQEVQPDAEQRKLMISYTTADESGMDPFDEIQQATEECNQILDRIVEIVYNKNNSFDVEMNNIQSILSPRQIAKFILWIDRNPACMQMLEALWPHLTHSTTTAGEDSQVNASAAENNIAHTTQSTTTTSSNAFKGSNGFTTSSSSSSTQLNKSMGFTSRNNSVQGNMSLMGEESYYSDEDSSDST
jgi:hypothetical protein